VEDTEQSEFSRGTMTDKSGIFITIAVEALCKQSGADNREKGRRYTRFTKDRSFEKQHVTG